MSPRRLGDFALSSVVETERALFDTAMVFPHATDDALKAQYDWMLPLHFVPDTRSLVLIIQSFLIRTGRTTILVDTCIGNHKPRARAHNNMQQFPWMARLHAAGVKPEEIDYVMCTHLHVDHVGWNTRLENGRWVPTFPNARYVFSKEDYEHYLALDRDPEKGPATLGAFRDSILPVVEAGLAQMVTGATALDESLSVEPAPGHTPGTLAIKFESRGEKALFCGDILHHALQVYRPEWNSFACAHAANARASRRKALEHCAAGALLMPVHFGAPFACRIESKGGAFLPRFAG